jgi:exopolysaccharide biosynthesis protein
MKQIILVLLIFASVVFGSYLISGGKAFPLRTVFSEGIYYVCAEDLAPAGVGYIHSNGYHYIVYDNHVLFIKEHETIFDFVEKLSPPIFADGLLFVPIDALKKVMEGYQVYTKGEKVLIYDSLPIVLSAAKEKNGVTITYTGTIVPDMVSVEKSMGKVRINLSPVVVSLPNVSEDIKVELEKNGLSFVVDVGNFYPDVEYSIGDGKLLFRFLLVEGFFGRQEVADGVVFERKIEEFDEGEKTVVNYLIMDPEKVTIKPVVVENGFGTIERLDEMVKRVGGIAGINGNYFDPVTKFPIGLVVIDGKPYSAMFSGRPVFAITEDNEVFIGRVIVDVTLMVKDVLFLVKGINTLGEGEVLVYTKEFSKEIPKKDDKIYFVVKDNKVSQIGYKSHAENSEYVVSISKKYEEYLSDLKEGDEVYISLQPNIPLRIKQAVEGGPLLIQNGAPIPDALEEKARYGGGIAYAKAPRTVIATKDGKLWFLVFEGYNHITRGLTYDELVDFLVSRGFEDAMCVDGGSSSVMAVAGSLFGRTENSTAAIPVGIVVWEKKKTEVGE